LEEIELEKTQNLTAKNDVYQDSTVSTKDKSRDAKLESNFRINIKSESKVTSSIKNLRKINNQKHLDAMYLEDKLKSLQKQVDEFKSRSNNSNSSTCGKKGDKLSIESLDKQNTDLRDVSINNYDIDNSVKEDSYLKVEVGLSLDNEINSSSVEKESIERKLNFSSGKKNDNNNSVKSKD